MKHSPTNDTTARTTAVANLINGYFKRLKITRKPPNMHQASTIWELACQVAETGRRLGLTKYTGPDAVLHRLILPGLVAFKWLDPEQPFLVAELGCGSGATGLALAALAPAWEITLVDRRRRVVAFVDLLIVRLRLGNVRTLRADAQQPAGEAAFDAALFRAVAPPHEDLEMARKWTRAGGLTVIWTTASQEPPEVRGWSLVDWVSLDSPPLAVMVYRHSPSVC